MKGFYRTFKLGNAGQAKHNAFVRHMQIERQRLKTPRKFDGYGQQRGFRKIAMKTTEEESENSEFVVVSEQEQMELPFD